MKRFLKRTLCVLTSLFVLMQTALPSYAWTSADGNNVDSDHFTNNYAISVSWASQGWLIYFVDDNQNVISDIVAVYQDMDLFYGSMWNGAVPRFNYTGHEVYKQVPIGNMNGLKMPFSEVGTTEVSNADDVKAWIESDIGKDTLCYATNCPDYALNPTEEDKYFLIMEAMYKFPVYSNVEGVPRRFIMGTTYGYSRLMLNSIIGTPDYPANVAPRDGLSDRGWYATCAFTNGFYGTFAHTTNEYLPKTEKIGITKSGDDYENINFANSPLPFSTLANKSIGLGLIVHSTSDNGEPPDGEEPPIPPVPPMITTDYIGTAKPDTFTYNYSSQFNLDKNNNPAGRIPSGEMLTNGIDVDMWYCDYSLKKVEPAPKTVSIVYDIGWWTINNAYTYVYNITEADYGGYASNPKVHDLITVGSRVIDEFNDPLHPTVKTGEHVELDIKYRGETENHQPYTAYIERKTYYYTIDDYNIYTFNKAVITCENQSGISAYTGNQIIYNGDYNVSYTKTDTGTVVHYPTNTTHSGTIWASDYNAGKLTCESRKSSDADDFRVRNDYLNVGGVTFVPNNEGQHGANYINVATYNFPNTGVGAYETPVTIPFTDPNGYYYTSGIYTYKSVLDPTKGVVITKNAPETHASKTSSINERIQSSFRQNEPVFVHTPVVSRIDTDGSGEVQLVVSRVNDAMVDYELRLDNTYEFEFDVEQHLNLMGYSLGGFAWDYARYVKKAEVLFPFDVAIVSNPSGANVYNYYKANTWIEVDYSIPTTYYIPTWATEMDYGEIYFRVQAYNINEYLDDAGIRALEQETHNLVQTNYVAYTKIAIQLSGYIYDLEVVGVNDSLVMEFNDDENHIVQLAKNLQEFRTGLLNRLGGTAVRYEANRLLNNAWNPKYTLPFSNGSSLNSNIAGTLGKGTTINFTVKTIANCWNPNDELVIIPRLRYVSSGGIEYDYDDTQVFYNHLEDYFVANASDRDIAIPNTGQPSVKIGDVPYVGTYSDDEITTTRNIYNNIHPSDTYSQNWSILTNNGKGTDFYHLGLIRIPETMKTYTGNEEDLSYNLTREGIHIIKLTDTSVNKNIGNSSYATVKANNGQQVGRNTQELFQASMQTWYGEWTIPSDIYVAFTSDINQYGDFNGDGVTDLDDYMDYTYKNGVGLTKGDKIWIKDGYLVLNFDIYLRKDGSDFLTYYGNPLTYNTGSSIFSGQNMMKTEGAKSALGGIVYVGGESNVPVTLRSGDVAIFDMLHDVSSYRNVGVGWTN